jgi:8-oxo-dGTP pyrophosphatase MutT (NUDIX family)
MRMIGMKTPAGRFTMRVAGIAVCDGFVLAHEDRDREFWVLPGGRAEFGEETRETLRREMAEEAGIDAEVGRLCFVMENFFSLRGERCHEIGFYYEMTVPAEWRPQARPSFTGVEGSAILHFRWLPIADLPAALRLEPQAIARRIPSLPATTELLTYRE